MIALTESQAWAIGIALVMMAMDIATGFIGAVITDSVSSSKMRVGLWHKAILLCIIAVAIVLEVAAQHVVGLPYSGVTTTVVCGYIVVMEVSSCLENAAKAYPELKGTKIMKIFEGEDKGEAH